MHGSGATLALAALLAALGGCSSTTPAAEQPSTPEPEAPTPEGPAAGGEPTAEPGGDAPAPPVKKSSKDSIADDYELTNHDCAQLGKQLRAVIRTDEGSKLSPKLKPNQREAAEASIDKAAVTREDQWVESCQKSLVGKTVDPQSLKCAVAAKSVKEFDECLNGPTTPPTK